MSTESPFTSSEAERYYALVGLYVTHWAFMESVLETQINLLWKHFGGSEIDTQIPLSLNRRITFIRKVARRVGERSHATKNHLDVTDEIKDEAEFRHDLIHGVNVDFQFLDVGRSTIMRSKNGVHALDQKKGSLVTIESLIKKNHKVVELTLRLHSITDVYIDLFETAIIEAEESLSLNALQNLRKAHHQIPTRPTPPK